MIELNWCVHFQDHKEEMAHHEMTRRLAQQWNNLSQEDKKVQYHASCRTVSGWKKDQKQSKQTKIISETWMTYESHLPGKLSFFPHITLHGAAWIFAFRGHQPLMDGKHCVIPGHAAHQCVMILMQKNYTAELLSVKWIHLLIIFSLGFHPAQGVLNLDPAFR